LKGEDFVLQWLQNPLRPEAVAGKKNSLGAPVFSAAKWAQQYFLIHGDILMGNSITCMGQQASVGTRS